MRDAYAQAERGQQLVMNNNLAGRALWNSQWLLVIPGGQWEGSTDPVAIRSKLMQFIYGPNEDPEDLRGITDIRWIIEAYTH